MCLPQHEPVVRHRRRLAVHLDVFPLIALREVGNGGDGRWLGWNRRLALLDSGDDRSGVLAGRLGSELGIPAERYALRPAERTRLDDEDLLAGGVDSSAEPGKIAVPEDDILAIDGQAVQDAFGESSVLGLRHGAVLLRRGSSVILPLSGDGGDGAGGDSVFFRIAAVVARGLHPPITRQRKDYDPAAPDWFRCRKHLGSARGSQMGSRCG